MTFPHIDPLVPPVPVENPYGLTPREVQIVYMTALGHSCKSCSQELYLAFDTVKTHTKHIRMKMMVSTMTEVVYRAVSEGWIPPARERSFMTREDWTSDRTSQTRRR